LWLTFGSLSLNHYTDTNCKEDDWLRQIFLSQQNLTAKYQELETLVKQYACLSQKHEELWNQKLLQESEWKDMIYEKLQFILDILRSVSGHPPSGHPTYPPANLEPLIAHFTPNFTQFAQNFTQLAPSFQAGQPSTFQAGQPSTFQAVQPSTFQAGQPSTFQAVQPSTFQAGQPSTFQAVQPSTFQAGQPLTYGQSPPTGQAPMQISTTEGSYSGQL
jgi:hypothetical protein